MRLWQYYCVAAILDRNAHDHDPQTRKRLVTGQILETDSPEQYSLKVGGEMHRGTSPKTTQPLPRPAIRIETTKIRHRHHDVSGQLDPKRTSAGSQSDTTRQRHCLSLQQPSPSPTPRHHINPCPRSQDLLLTLPPTMKLSDPLQWGPKGMGRLDEGAPRGSPLLPVLWLIYITMTPTTKAEIKEIPLPRKRYTPRLPRPQGPQLKLALFS